VKLNRFSFIFQSTFDVGVPKTLKLPCPFLVKAGLWATLAVGDTAFFVARDVDGLGVFARLAILPADFEKSALWIFGRTPHWGSTQLRSN
jgi:hypothetical protein